MNRDDLYRIWKAEKSETSMQTISSSFYNDMARLLRECEASAAATGQDLTQKALFQRELKILRRLIREVAETRMNKILNASLCSQEIPAGGLASEEEEFAKQIMLHVGGHCRFIEELAKHDEGPVGATVTVKPAEPRREVVRFVSDFPALVGVDLKTYGPFKAEDIATLPTENASALISQGVVKVVHFSEGIAQK